MSGSNAASAPNTCAFMVYFPLGTANNEAKVTSFFAEKGIDCTIRVSNDDKFENFVSFEITSCDTRLVQAIPDMTAYNVVRSIAMPGPIVNSKNTGFRMGISRTGPADDL
ncbi:hypothetical protein BC830DRAFT_1080486 [Chytriomyces sp. MP71]|nr:hypothetical protein BC830DRAFT_1080486 [Chytriomyces sp. MP71]